jgi:hypothetical protein
VTVGTTGPMGSGLPQFGFPRRFAIDFYVLERVIFLCNILGRGLGDSGGPEELCILFYGYFVQKSIGKARFSKGQAKCEPGEFSLLFR